MAKATEAGRIEYALSSGPHGDDTEAIEFWRNPPEWIAAGATPNEALANLLLPPQERPKPPGEFWMEE